MRLRKRKRLAPSNSMTLAPSLRNNSNAAGSFASLKLCPAKLIFLTLFLISMNGLGSIITSYGDAGKMTPAAQDTRTRVNKPTNQNLAAPSPGPSMQIFDAGPSASLKLTEIQGNYMLVGSLNAILNVSLLSLQEVRRIDWAPSLDDNKMCRYKGKTSSQCQNYIRVLKLQRPDTLYVCGTNAYRPLCRRYLIRGDHYELLSELPGDGHCPHQETQDATALYVDDELYSATVAQFSGTDALIYREPLRTEQFNVKQLNAPNFVSSFHYGEHVYFLFREQATELLACGGQTNMRLYSRIARVCKHDKDDNRHLWSTFSKTRLNCSIANDKDFAFHFDEVQASTQVVYRSPGQQPVPNLDLFYATFSTPRNSIGGSAICAYRMSDVLAAFENPYKQQADLTISPSSVSGASNVFTSSRRGTASSESVSSSSSFVSSLPSTTSQFGSGLSLDLNDDASDQQKQQHASTCEKCAPEKSNCSEEAFNYMRENPLIDQALGSLWSQPLLTMVTLNFRFTHIAVQPEVAPQGALGASTMRTDVIFVATDDGRVLKLINTHHLRPFIELEPSQVGSSSPLARPMELPSQISGVQSVSPSHQQTGARATLESERFISDTLSNSGYSQSSSSSSLLISSSTTIVEELLIFDSRTPINNLIIYNPQPRLKQTNDNILSTGLASNLSTSDSASESASSLDESTSNPATSGNHAEFSKLIVVASNQIKAIPLSRCGRAANCRECLALRDPFCAWNEILRQCLSNDQSVPISNSDADLQDSSSLSNLQASAENFESNSTYGWWSECPVSSIGKTNLASSQGSAMTASSIDFPYRSLFSGHLQAPSRFDFASGHHLAQVNLISLLPATTDRSSQYSYNPAQMPASECLSFCGPSSLYYGQSRAHYANFDKTRPVNLLTTCLDISEFAPSAKQRSNLRPTYSDSASAPASASVSVDQLRNPIAANSYGLTMYTSENFYFAVIFCVSISVIIGFALGYLMSKRLNKNSHKQKHQPHQQAAGTSLCSSNESNLYMASTSSHPGTSLFYSSQQHLTPRTVINYTAGGGTTVQQVTSLPPQPPPLPPPASLPIDGHQFVCKSTTQCRRCIGALNISQDSY